MQSDRASQVQSKHVKPNHDQIFCATARGGQECSMSSEAWTHQQQRLIVNYSPSRKLVSFYANEPEAQIIVL